MSPDPMDLPSVSLMPDHPDIMFDLPQLAMIYDPSRPLWKALAAERPDLSTAVGRTQLLALIAKHGSELDLQLIVDTVADQAKLYQQLALLAAALNSVVRDCMTAHDATGPDAYGTAIRQLGRIAGTADAALSKVIRGYTSPLEPGPAPGQPR